MQETEENDETTFIYGVPTVIRALTNLGLTDFFNSCNRHQNLKVFADKLQLAVTGIPHILCRRPPETAIKSLFPLREVLDLHGDRVWPTEGPRPWLSLPEDSQLLYNHDDAWE